MILDYSATGSYDIWYILALYMDWAGCNPFAGVSILSMKNTTDACSPLQVAFLAPWLFFHAWYENYGIQSAMFPISCYQQLDFGSEPYMSTVQALCLVIVISKIPLTTVSHFSLFHRKQCHLKSNLRKGTNGDI